MKRLKKLETEKKGRIVEPEDVFISKKDESYPEKNKKTELLNYATFARMQKDEIG
jgi:hypothetical protein